MLRLFFVEPAERERGDERRGADDEDQRRVDVAVDRARAFRHVRKDQAHFAARNHRGPDDDFGEKRFPLKKHPRKRFSDGCYDEERKAEDPDEGGCPVDLAQVEREADRDEKDRSEEIDDRAHLLLDPFAEAFRLVEEGGEGEEKLP